LLSRTVSAYATWRWASLTTCGARGCCSCVRMLRASTTVTMESKHTALSSAASVQRAPATGPGSANPAPPFPLNSQSGQCVGAVRRGSSLGQCVGPARWGSALGQRVGAVRWGAVWKPTPVNHQITGTVLPSTASRRERKPTTVHGDRKRKPTTVHGDRKRKPTTVHGEKTAKTHNCSRG
jgi:hypothetical protein